MEVVNRLKTVRKEPDHKTDHTEQNKRRFQRERAIAPIVQAAETVVDFVVVVALQVQLLYVVVHVNGYFRLGGRSASLERVCRYVRPQADQIGQTVSGDERFV